MRNTFFAAIFAFAILGTQSLSAAPAAVTANIHIGTMCECCEPPCCPPMIIRIYTATIKGEIKDADAAKKLENLLKGIDGVSSVTVDMKTNEATIHMFEDYTLSKEAIEEALEDSGFEVIELANAIEE